MSDEPNPLDIASEPEADDAASGETSQDAETLVPPPPADGIKRRWYAIHAHSGQEANIKKNLLVLAEQGGIKDVIGDILVPMEEVRRNQVRREENLETQVLSRATSWSACPNIPSATPTCGT